MMWTNLVLTFFIVSLSINTAWSQSSQVGIIDFYGVPSMKKDFKKCLPFKENDTLQILLHFPDTTGHSKLKRTVLDCLLAKPGIKQADIQFTCCVATDGKWMVYVGALDKPKRIIADTKTADLKLPAEITQTYDSLNDSVQKAVESGEAGDDHSQGHSLFAHLPTRRLQEKFIGYAKIHLSILRNVIKSSKYPYQRSVASTVIAYYHDKKVIINDLLLGAVDSDEGVRNDAIRAIWAIEEFSQEHSGLNIQIPPDPFIELMNSISWTDRNKSSAVLEPLSRKRDPKLLSQLKREALQPLIDMATWKSDFHSLNGYWILGRIAGWTDQEINDSIRKDRSEMIQKMQSTIK